MTPELSITPEAIAAITAGAPVAIGISGGKDSCAVAIALVQHLRRVGYAGETILIHSDLGRVEWTDSIQTCRRLSSFLGIELMVVRRQAGDMMDRWLKRWENSVRRYANLECVKVILPWSTPKMRFCTSELKTDVICGALAKRFHGNAIISVSGIRRQESATRAKAPICKPQPKLTSKKNKTTGCDLHPIIEWTLDDVLGFLDREGFPLHEAYTKYGCSRVSCRFCIMGSRGDIAASAAVPEHLPLLIEMVELEIRSTFGFQSHWLGDMAGARLSEDMRQRVEDSKHRAAERERFEAQIPPHLLYTKGWPTCLPTQEEAELLASIRREIGALLEIEVLYTTAESILLRYEELMMENQQRLLQRPRRPRFSRAAEAAAKG